MCVLIQHGPSLIRCCKLGNVISGGVPDGRVPLEAGDDRRPLVDLDGGIDFSDEGGRADVAESPTHQPQSPREQRHVAEVEGRLEEAVHPEMKVHVALQQGHEWDRVKRPKARRPPSNVN